MNFWIQKSIMICIENNDYLKNRTPTFINDLTAVFFETGAMPVPTKSRNPTLCGSGDPFHSYLAHS